MQREVVFSARDQGVMNLIQQYANVTERLSQTLLRTFGQEKQSAKENISDYEKQINLLEKKNRLEKQSVDTKRQSGQDRPQSTAFEVERTKPVQLPGQGKDRDQITVLRELIQVIKDTSSDQISNRTELFQSLVSAFSGQAGGGFSGEATTVPASRGGGRKGGGGFNFGGIASSMGGRLPGNLGSMTRMAGPWAILGAAITAQVLPLFEEMKRENALSPLAGMMGENVKYLNYLDIGRARVGRRDRGTYGVSEDEFMARLVPTARALGTAVGINEQTIDAIALERGTGVDNASILQMQRLARVLPGSRNATGVIQSVFGAMAGTGAFGRGDRDLTRMNELAQTFTQFQEAQFLRTGTTAGNEFLNVRRQLEGMGGRFRRDDYAAQTISSLNAGLAGGGSPETDAIKMDILRRANPNMGYFELQAEMSKGLGAKGLAEGIFNMVQQTGGTIDQKSILFNQMTKGALNPEDVMSLMRGEMDFKDIQKDIEGGRLDVNQRAEAATSDLAQAMENVKGELSKFIQEALDFQRALLPVVKGVQLSLDTVIKLLK